MIKDPYKKSAKFYNTFVKLPTIVLRKKMFKMAPPREGMHVLETGCGTGINLKFYQEAGCRVNGIDSSPSMVKIARTKLGKPADIRLGTASQMPYRDGCFDLVIAMLTLHEMHEFIRPLVINEMVRVMKKNGHLLLVDFHPGPVRFPKGWIAKVIILFFERLAGGEHFKNYRNFIAGKGLSPLMEKNNLYIEKYKIVGGGNIALFSVKKPS